MNNNGNAEEILKDLEASLPSWDEILSDAGKGIEDIGRMLRGRGRKKPRVWSVEELQELRSALMSHRKIIKYYIEDLKEQKKESS